MPKVLVIVGPTASGKSALAVKMARKFNGEIISADSRQVYKGLTIGTGKITKKEMGGIPHHLLDVASPKKVFSAADFTKLGQAAIGDILSRGKLPIVCGGTGFYIDALLGRISVPEVPPNESLRRRLQKKAAAELHTMLTNLDPERAASIDKQNPVRLIRAIEIAKKLGSVPPPRKDKSFWDVLWIGIEWPEEKLKKRIHERLLTRMKQGMLSEAQRLHTKGLTWKRMRELGLEYRNLADLLEKKIARTQFLERLEIEITRYAKHQKHYWKRNTGICWIPASRLSSVTKMVRDFLKASPRR